MKALKFTLAGLLSMLVLASCGSGAKKQDEDASDTYDLESYIETAEAIEPDLDRVEQVFSILDMVNAEYYDVLANDPYSAHSYKSSYPVAAANLGVYMADVLYHFYGGANEEMYLTFAAAQELARFIGVESKFATWTIEQLEGSVMSRDTITKIFNNLLEESEKYSTEQELVFVHTSFLTGSFVEKVYISGSLLQQKMGEDELTQEQEGDIRELLVIYMNQLDPATTVLYKALEQQGEQLEALEILATLDRLRATSEELKEKKPSLAVAPVEEIATDETLGTTFKLVTDLRKAIVTATN